jgi:hypothetical protein
MTRKKPSGRDAGRLSHATAGPALLRFRRIYRQGCCKLVNEGLTESLESIASSMGKTGRARSISDAAGSNDGNEPGMTD